MRDVLIPLKLMFSLAKLASHSHRSEQFLIILVTVPLTLLSFIVVESAQLLNLDLNKDFETNSMLCSY